MASRSPFRRHGRADPAERIRGRSARRASRQSAFLLSALDLDAAEAPLSFTRTVIRGDQFRFSLVLRQQEAEGVMPSHGPMAYMT